MSTFYRHHIRMCRDGVSGQLSGYTRQLLVRMLYCGLNLLASKYSIDQQGPSSLLFKYGPSLNPTDFQPPLPIFQNLYYRKSLLTPFYRNNHRSVIPSLTHPEILLQNFAQQQYLINSTPNDRVKHTHIFKPNNNNRKPSRWQGQPQSNAYLLR